MEPEHGDLCLFFHIFFLQGSLNYPFGGNQTIQIYGNFEGFPLQQRIVWVGNIMTPVLEVMILRFQPLFWVCKAVTSSPD